MSEANMVDPLVESLINGLVNNEKKESQHDTIDEVITSSEPEDNLESSILRGIFESDDIESTHIPIKKGRQFNPKTGRIE